ncbi:MauE/DoxX family redox-associated membrane protein [Chloroflexota bacterium]
MKRYRYWLGTGASLILGIIFIAAGLGKLMQPSTMLDVFFNYFPDFGYLFLAPAFASAITVGIPILELILGIFLVTGIFARLATLLTIPLITGFIASNTWLLTHGQQRNPCDCFGGFTEILGIELTNTSALYLDFGMAALVLMILFCYQRRFFSFKPWFLREGEG